MAISDYYKHLGIRSELIKISYENLSFSILASVLIAVVLVLGIWNSSNRVWLGSWLGIMALMGVLRYLTAQSFFKDPSRYSIKEWENRFYIGFLSTSGLWAVFITFFFPQDNVLQQSFVVMMMLGLASGAVGSLSAHKRHIYTFFLFVLVPLAVMMFLEGTTPFMMLSGMILVYMLMLTGIATRFHDNLVQSIGNKILFNESQLNLQNSEERFAKIFQQVPIGIFSYDHKLHITELNQALADILHVDIERLKGFDLYQISNDAIIACVQKALSNEHASYEGPYTTFYKKLELWLNIKTIPVLNSESNVVGGLAIVNDITDKKKSEERIEFLAYHDELTKLPNRTLLNDRLEHLISHVKRSKIYAALMFIDLDHFKTINDSLGHHVGDELLKEFTQRLNYVIRKEDTLSRLGGDEFILMLPELSHNKFNAINMALSVAGKVHEVMKPVFRFEQHTLHISASIGVTLIDAENNDQNDILKHADLAMYKAKEEGRNRTCFYEEQMDVAIKKRLKMENDLHLALKANEFELYYQPIVECQSNKVVCAEALLRYCKNDGTTIYPDEFIYIAEESGLIIPIGYWVIEEACRQFAAWRDKNFQFNLQHIAINISPKQFMQNEFVDRLVAIVREHHIDCSVIELELTESVVMDNKTKAIAKMKQLKELGFILSMDDFGTGYSSLSYLKNLPFDIIKIDRSFMKNIMSRKDDETLVNTILDICEQFDLKVIAEGVETIEHVNFLQQSSCNYYQGYVVSRPVTAERFERFLN